MKQSQRVVGLMLLFGCSLFTSAQQSISTTTSSTVPSPADHVFSRIGPAICRTARHAIQAGHRAQSPDATTLTLTFGMVDFPGQSATGAFGVNDSGEIAGGFGGLANDGVSNHGFLLKGTKFTELNYPGAAYTSPNSINDSGVVVGQYATSSNIEQGFELVGNTYTTIDYPGAVFTSANGINKSGQVVGAWEDGNGVIHGFLLSDGVFTSIDMPGEIATFALGINSSGEIVGLYTDANYDTHGFLDDNGTFTTIDYPGGNPQNYLSGINDQGVIVGGYGDFTSVNGEEYQWNHGFIYKNGQFANVDVPFGPPVVTEPNQISNNGVIVGFYVDASGTIYGYEATVKAGE